MNLRALARDLERAARLQNWSLQTTVPPAFWLYRAGTPRPDGQAPARLYISAGIHGDEPSGPTALLRLVQEAYTFGGLEVFLFPMLNPSGLSMGTRENADNIDLNRDYLACTSLEIQTHLAILDKLGPFDAALCLHEDWESKGCYLYALNTGEGPGCHAEILRAMSQHLPIDPTPLIDGHESVEGLIQRHPSQFDRPDWPEAIYLCRHHTPLCYTVETPSSADLETRARAHIAAITQTVRYLAGRTG